MSSKKELIEEEDNAGWIYTFADLMTLLLVFFVLLFSLSSVEVDRFEKAMRSLNDAFQGEDGANSVIELPHEAPVKTEVPEEIEEVLPATNIADAEGEKPQENEAEFQDIELQTELNRMADEVSQELQAAINSDMAEIGTPKDGKLVISLKGDVVFDPGSAEFHAEMMTTFDSIVLLMKKNPDYKLRINGHTDNIPIQTTRFPSNWDLSAIRATNVLRYMVRGGIDLERVTATGYGESVPLESNRTLEGRAKNRRLEFVLEKEDEK
ncbi:OmpA/MotB family protein [Neptuniibacter caesariensis]|uniref:OmpA/MotB n=1 Tax=Neptuniibacter caesariensis TaxID=207954 RepID=A0A7U8GS80_NEPCE|nr:OmpA family protein [Neptuniibacter caesariensis]EAR61033.1 OmpA/MotB [Neptuniibacter caesariensis]